MEQKTAPYRAIEEMIDDVEEYNLIVEEIFVTPEFARGLTNLGIRITSFYIAHGFREYRATVNKYFNAPIVIMYFRREDEHHVGYYKYGENIRDYEG